MDAGRLSICGEESFGTGSDHIREKDGLWAIVGKYEPFPVIRRSLTFAWEAWLNIIAAANKESPNKLIGINELLQEHYAKYGRSFFTRYDYEEVSSEGANKLVAHLNAAIETSSLADTKYHSKSTGQDYKIASVSNFSYIDPIDKSVSKNQGQIVLFDDGSRVVFRLSGTGSAGATVRMYVERYVAPDAGEKELSRNTAEGLKGLIEVALEITKLKEFLQREEPTVITVRADGSFPLYHRLKDGFSSGVVRLGRVSMCTMVWNRISTFFYCAEDVAGSWLISGNSPLDRSGRYISGVGCVPT